MVLPGSTSAKAGSPTSLSSRLTPPVRLGRVDADGIELWGYGDRVVDVLLDGRRVWSFWLVRDTETTRGRPGRRTIGWPPVLAKFLDGTTRLTLREHVSGRVLLDEERTFGSSAARIAVVNKAGAPMGLDKSGRMSATFDTRSEADVAPLLQAIAEVLDLLESAGNPGFIAYGTLLGAVREGRFLGHDSDADLAYVSHTSHPADVVRESFALQRVINERGYATQRYSGAAFRVDVVEADGVVRGLDVFAGFLDDGRLYLMGEVAADFRREWVYPTTTATLEGRAFAVPAAPERWLEATYGPSWAVPDPAFKFTTAARTEQQLTGWFRGSTIDRQLWERSYSSTRDQLPSPRPSRLARRLYDELGTAARVIDLGAGRGGDALWLARQGARVTAYDYVPTASRAVQRAAADEGLDLEVRTLNLTEWRSVFAEGARLAHAGEPHVVLARHVADATNGFGRDSLARLCAMALRGGGRLYLDVWTGAGRAPGKLRPLTVDDLSALLVRHGATILSSGDLPPRPPAPGRGRASGRRYSIGRLVAQWQ